MVKNLFYTSTDDFCQRLIYCSRKIFGWGGGSKEKFTKCQFKFKDINLSYHKYMVGVIGPLSHHFDCVSLKYQIKHQTHKSLPNFE